MGRRQAVSVRFPEKALAGARAVKAAQESLNDFVVTAVEREVGRRQGEAALWAIRRVREQVRARTGLHPDPVPLIRALREGLDRRD